METRFRPRWPTSLKLLVSVILLALFVYLLFRFSVVIPPLILAVILAYILSPLVKALQARLRVGRTVAILLSYLILLAGVAVLPLVIVPTLSAQLADLNVDIQLLLRQAQVLLGQQYVIAGQVIDVTTIFAQIVGSLQQLLEPIFGRTLDLVVELISSAVWVIFVVVISFYLLRDSGQLWEWLEKLPPPAYRDDFIRLREEINQIWEAFFRGQLVLAVVVSTIFIVIGFILGLPFALAMGVLAGLLEFLPSIGHGIWLTLAALLAFSLGSTWLPLPNWVFALMVVGLHLFFQQFDLNYLIPRIIGRRVHLPPLVVILGIVSGAVLAGVLGIPLAAPTIASARIIGRYVYANLFDLDPFGGSITLPLPPPNPQWWRRPPQEQQPHGRS